LITVAAILAVALVAGELVIRTRGSGSNQSLTASGASNSTATATQPLAPPRDAQDRKSTRLNSSHVEISYAVFCLKKKEVRYGNIRFFTFPAQFCYYKNNHSFPEFLVATKANNPLAPGSGTNPRPSKEAVRQEINNILTSPQFVNSPILQNFLRFIVEKTLAGKSSSIKGYLVSTEVLGKETDFDPFFFPAVRSPPGPPLFPYTPLFR